MAIILDADAGITAPGLTIGSDNVSAVGGFTFRNKLINANPTINQRGYVSGTATTGANQYTLDRWRVVTSGQNVSWTDSGITRTLTCPAGGLEQVIEGLNIEGGTFVLDWQGTATATVNGNAVSKGGTFSLTAGSNATVRFNDGTLSLPQLEAGSVATPFERRPIGAELALCQRYFQRWDSSASVFARVCVGACYVTDGFVGVFNLPVTMRAAPTLELASAGNTFRALMAGSAFTASAVSISELTTSTIGLNLTIPGGTPGHGGWASANNTIAAFLNFSSEM